MTGSPSSGTFDYTRRDDTVQTILVPVFDERICEAPEEFFHVDLSTTR